MLWAAAVDTAARTSIIGAHNLRVIFIFLMLRYSASVAAMRFGSMRHTLLYAAFVSQTEFKPN